MRIKFKRGILGRWRWFIYDDHGKYRGSGRVRGFKTEQAAVADAIAVFGASVIIPSANGEQFAGQRDFDN